MFYHSHYHQQFADDFYRQGPEVCLQTFSDFMEGVAEARGIEIEAGHQGALLVLSMMLAPFFLEMIFYNASRSIHGPDLDVHAKWVAGLLSKGFPQGLKDNSL